jgi:asparagine synthase (glutamine-hydrolysing)
MCGITGFNWEDTRMIQKMNEAIAHRGPDDHGVYTDETVSLGNRRLAIIDLSPSGRQPMSNEDETIWITYNGEVYNFQEIKKDLEKKGHVFTSKSDTEVIIHGYEEYGIDILHRLNGMFAFVIYDSDGKNLILARDRFGIKPLYYYWHHGNFIFCSEIKGILIHDIERSPNNKMIFEYLQNGMFDYCEETFFENICRVLPGTYVVFDLKTHTITKERWYSLKDKTVLDPQKIKDSFFNSVTYRLVSDVPVGSCLSGGIDSSSIVCTMKEVSPHTDIKTFSAVFPGTSIDESKYIKKVVEKTEVHSETIVPDVETLIEELDDLIWTQEEPFMSTSIYAQYSVMKLAHNNGMKVLLDGQGGDELLAGYLNYFSYYFLELLTTLKWKLLVCEAVSYIKQHKNVIPMFQLLSNIVTLGFKPRGFMHTWMNKEFFNQYSRLRTPEVTLNEKLVEALTYSTIPGLLRYEDKNAMRWSVETRLPFLDHTFVERVLYIPPTHKIKKGITKYIFRKALQDVLPEEIRERTDKIGFATPEDQWFQSEKFTELAENILDSDSFKKREYWDEEKVKKAFEKFKKGKKRLNRTVWKWINLELWLRMFIDG